MTFLSEIIFSSIQENNNFRQFKIFANLFISLQQQQATTQHTIFQTKLMSRQLYSWKVNVFMEHANGQFQNASKVLYACPTCRMSRVTKKIDFTFCDLSNKKKNLRYRLSSVSAYFYQPLQCCKNTNRCKFQPEFEFEQLSFTNQNTALSYKDTNLVNTFNTIHLGKTVVHFHSYCSNKK